MKTVRIEWEEVSYCSVHVNVPDDFDIRNYPEHVLDDLISDLQPECVDGVEKNSQYAASEVGFRPYVERLISEDSEDEMNV